MQALLHIVLLVFDWLFGLGGAVYSPESALTLALAGGQLRTPAGFYNTSPMDLKAISQRRPAARYPATSRKMMDRSARSASDSRRKNCVSLMQLRAVT